SISAADVAHATVINFDDLDANTTTFLPTPTYDGFIWSGGGGNLSWILGATFQNVPGFTGTTAFSGTNYAWSNGPTDLSMSAPVGTFTLDSLRLRLGNGNTGNENSIIMHGFDGATEIFTQTLLLTTTYTLFTLDWSGITSWSLTNASNNTLVDDIT